MILTWLLDLKVSGEKRLPLFLMEKNSALKFLFIASNLLLFLDNNYYVIFFIGFFYKI